MAKCRVCGSQISPFMSFGKMPIANGFLTADQFSDEYFFELTPGFCDHCGMFQLIKQPAPEKMFHENYAFFSSTSRYMQMHFKAFAEFVMNGGFLKHKNAFVVELGSNDGIMLRHFRDAGFRHLGIEPSENVAAVARSLGIESLSEFFDLSLADRIVEKYGHADVVLAANVMCHIPDINAVAAGIARLLTPDGVLIFEDPYLGDMIAKTSYDQIYDEHVFIFSVTSITAAFGSHGMELIDVIPQITHGGSMRYVLAHKGSHRVSDRVGALRAQEQAQGLHDPKTYDQFRINCESSRAALVDLLDKLRLQNKRIVGYGATSKSTTVMNYCKIGPEHIEFISDTTPIKQGKFSPGVHIPVKFYEAFERNYPDYALLFAWNHAKEIFEKEESFKKRGGKWITFVPRVGVIE